MVSSHREEDSPKGRTDVLSFLDVSMNLYAFGRDQHSCALLSHSMSKDRASRLAEPPPPSSRARVRAFASDQFRHTSCSMSGWMSGWMTDGAADRGADQIESHPISPRGLRFVRDEAVPSFTEAIGLESFSRMQPRSESSDLDCFERIVRQPSRRDSQCVPI